MNIEKGSIVAKQEQPAMWGKVVDIFLHDGTVLVKADPKSVERTGVGTFVVHVSKAVPHVE